MPKIVSAGATTKLIPFPRRQRKGLLRTAIQDETRLYAALKSLFDLLENYGPVWYTKHHHDKAKNALVMHGRTLKEGHRDSRKAA
jgi:hypothetical protein